MDAKFRKDKDTLVVTGTGAIAFGAWSVLKAVMVTVDASDELLKNVDPEEHDLILMLAWIILGVILAGTFGLNLYVGLAARAEGMGKKKRKYRVLACLMLAGQLFLAVVSVVDTIFGDADEEILVATLMDILGIFMLLDLVRAAYAVRHRMKEETRQMKSGKEG